MYFQSDYVLRMIQMMGDFFRRLLDILDEFIKNEEYDKFIRKQCGISSETAENLSADSLIAMLPDGPRFMLSELFYVRANAFNLDDEKRADCLYKALRLLLSVGKENLLCEMRQERLLSLYDDVYENLTAEDSFAIVSFLITAEDYYKAEDVLFDALNSFSGADYAMLLEKGIAAYEKLMAESPNPELSETLQELKQKQDLNA
jgi:hypothetical protein